MLSELNQRLVTLREDIRHREATQRRLHHAERSSREESTRRDQLQQVLDEERADVERLDGLSLTALFYTVLGSKAQQLEKERQEYLAAKLKCDESESQMAVLAQDIEDLRAELERCGDPEREYQVVLDEKERLIQETDGASARLLDALAQQLGELNADRNEIQEALRAGQSADAALEEVAGSLNSASNWGTWDLIGGGLISTAVKYSRIDSARDSAHRARSELQRFERELEDVGAHAEIDIEIGSFAKFADYFFDGLIADWIVQSRIRQSLESVELTRRHVGRALRRLKDNLREVESGIKDVKRRARETIEKA